jgi:hypothetical protein
MELLAGLGSGMKRSRQCERNYMIIEEVTFCSRTYTLDLLTKVHSKLTIVGVAWCD